MTIRLFDEIERTDLDSASFSESSFRYLNRSARPQFNNSRNILEDWFSRYPTAHQNELFSQFRSNNNFQFQAAFFELLLHEMLLKLGCKVDVHPKVKNTNKVPDFFVQTQDSDMHDFFLEATVVAFQSSEETAAEARLNTIYDVLNKYVDSSNFFIDVKVNNGPSSPPPARKIARFLNKNLQEVDPDEMLLLYNENYDSVPKWVFHHEEWSILFRPIPKKPSARGKLNSSPLGMFSGEFKQIDHKTPLRNAILDKANSYGELDKPLIVAINAMAPVDDYDLMNALFGQEKITYYVTQELPVEVVKHDVSREPDGAWTSYSGPKNTRVSAVLLARHLHPWSITNADLRLYHNPWASKPYTSVITRFPQSVPDNINNKMDMVDGVSLIDVLGLPKTEF